MNQVMKNRLKSLFVLSAVAVTANTAMAASTVTMDTSQVVTDLGTLAIGTAIAAIAAIKILPSAAAWGWNKLSGLFGR